MFSESIGRIAGMLVLSSLFFQQSCAVRTKLTYIESEGMAPGISLPLMSGGGEDEGTVPESVPDSDMTDNDGGPVILNAIRDTETGEMVATDVIKASTVTARFRNVAERCGKINIEFDITVPESLIYSRWQLEFVPTMTVMQDTLDLDPVYITGEKYRSAQLRGYQRYQAFIDSIITDSSEFVMMEQLTLFIRRNYPETYAMRNDTSFIAEPDAVNYFGVSQKEALEHYTRHLMYRRNERKKQDREKMFGRYVKAPFIEGGARLDTVIASSSGDIVYRYSQRMAGIPGLKKIKVSLSGRINEDGRRVHSLPVSDSLVYYVSSLSSLVDETPRYNVRILERTVTDRTNAFLDFHKGSADMDTLDAGNLAELKRIRRCLDDVFRRKEFELDSLLVTASCSLEGKYEYNSCLAKERSECIVSYMGNYMGEENRKLLRAASVPENWEYFSVLVRNDSLLTDGAKRQLLSLTETADRDYAEAKISEMPEYRYLREKIYPKLRTVKLEFHMHRRGLVKDTVHTAELDTVYMEGVEAIKRMDYARAMEILRPYSDYNAALACLSAGYEEPAAEILEHRAVTAKDNYLMAILLSRMGRKKEAMSYFRKSVKADPSMSHRANLDPELADMANDERDSCL